MLVSMALMSMRCTPVAVFLILLAGMLPAAAQEYGPPGSPEPIAAEQQPQAKPRKRHKRADAPRVPLPVARPQIAATQPEAKPEVKTVKVRSSVDVMAELEALRKRATNNPAAKASAKRDVLADLNALRPKRDLSRTLHLQLPPGVLARTKSVRVTLAFEDGEEAVIDTQNQQLELGDASDVQSLSVNLKIDLA